MSSLARAKLPAVAIVASAAAPLSFLPTANVTKIGKTTAQVYIVLAARSSPSTLLPEPARTKAAAEMTRINLRETFTLGVFKMSLATTVAAVIRQESAEDKIALAITKKKSTLTQVGN